MEWLQSVPGENRRGGPSVPRLGGAGRDPEEEGRGGDWRRKKIEKEVSIRHDGPRAHAQVKCPTPRTGSGAEVAWVRFQQQVFGEQRWEWIV